MTVEAPEALLCEFAHGERRPLASFVWSREVGE